jgi:hypothetical protein
MPAARRATGISAARHLARFPEENVTSTKSFLD